MRLLLAAMLQAVSASPPERIDLTIRQPCSESADSEEVVVCARRGESPYRLKEVPPPATKQTKAEVKIAGGVSVGAETESADVGGFASNRAMLRFKLKF